MWFKNILFSILFMTVVLVEAADAHEQVNEVTGKIRMCSEPTEWVSKPNSWGGFRFGNKGYCVGNWLFTTLIDANYSGYVSRYLERFARAHFGQTIRLKLDYKIKFGNKGSLNRHLVHVAPSEVYLITKEGEKLIYRAQISPEDSEYVSYKEMILFSPYADLMKRAKVGLELQKNKRLNAETRTRHLRYLNKEANKEFRKDLKEKVVRYGAWGLYFSLADLLYRMGDDSQAENLKAYLHSEKFKDQLGWGHSHVGRLMIKMGLTQDIPEWVLDKYRSRHWNTYRNARYTQDKMYALTALTEWGEKEAFKLLEDLAEDHPKEEKRIRKAIKILENPRINPVVSLGIPIIGF